MRFDILTIFPEIFDSYINESILKRAQENKIITINTHDIRKFSKNKHKKVDDMPYGGGAGMVMTPQPLYDAIKHIKKTNKGPVIFLTPSGEMLTQSKVEKLSKKYSEIILLCGRYEGIDQRIIETLVDIEISIGKYVLTGGELPALTLIDAMSRLVPGVLGKDESHEEDSFSKSLDRKKEYPHYTRPANFKGAKVPEVLLSGDHKKIAAWRKKNLR
ncbi:tRNA (guanosine(37)-N1)-methyltransferase TrmD [Candidatus Peregrinibacteria bacterium CG10_big_fil_rev_8_21_14_0_10_36_19]|nr:MAG: tRNA (guanosine(37)-N1)-methyltransferase TrmD [Candidatus Peregrinibacteria bacterium CG10_big_fil_rev_8_21_14_0_10_36_19]